MLPTFMVHFEGLKISVEEVNCRSGGNSKRIQIRNGPEGMTELHNLKNKIIKHEEFIRRDEQRKWS